MTILDDATKAVADRGASYGTPTENHGRTAAMWSAYLGMTVTAFDVCMLNILQKTSRAKCDSTHRDNLVDIAGYAENAERIACPVPVPVPAVRSVDERVCPRCDLAVLPARSIEMSAEGLRYAAITWRCTCGWREVRDYAMWALCRQYPETLKTTSQAVAPAEAEAAGVVKKPVRANSVYRACVYCSPERPRPPVPPETPWHNAFCSVECARLFREALKTTPQAVAPAAPSGSPSPTAPGC